MFGMVQRKVTCRILYSFGHIPSISIVSTLRKHYWQWVQYLEMLSATKPLTLLTIVSSVEWDL